MENEKTTVPYIAYEGTLARMERVIKGLVIALIVAFALLFASNAIWIFCMAADKERGNIRIDGRDGNASYNYIHKANAIYYGEPNGE